jgi:hypothetical protein
MIEFTEIIPTNTKINEFVKEQARWVNMYKMSTFSFSMQLVDLLIN